MSVWDRVVSTRSWLPSSNPRSTAACTINSLMACSVCGVRRLKSTFESIMFRDRVAAEIVEAAQAVAIGNAFARFSRMSKFLIGLKTSERST